MKACFGLSLQTGIQFIALIDIINSILITVTVVSVQEWHSERLLVIILELVNVFLGIILAFGASKRSTLVCKLWIAYTVIHSSTLLTYISYQLIHGLEKQDGDHSPEELIITISYVLVYKGYAVYVTVQFTAEINQFGGLNETLIHLSDKEVEEFLYETLEVEEPITNEVGGNASLRRAAYDKTYEISLDQLEIEPLLLGRGKYGKIHSGYLHTPTEAQAVSNAGNGTSVIHFEKKRVAVKMLENTEVDSIYFKALLTELKIMIYLGEHPNIVRLIGVCTAEIRKKHLWIVLELCELGNLHNYIQSIQGFSTDIETTEPHHLQLTDVYQWATQIARALEYMETKHVVHGDLSARNILLTSTREAKVSDFGLSRKLMQGRDEWEDVPLPWRWMAIESLLNLEFSSKSDVWSYGVLLWEIFTLGETPFAGASWNSEFIKSLIMGSRLVQPKHAPKEIYEILQECWIRDPLKRPSFSELASTFQGFC